MTNLFSGCRLSIPYEEVGFVREYWTEVFEPFLDAYSSGVQTPNPDVYCNRHIKFHKFRDYAFSKLKVDLIATGHYVRLEQEEGAATGSGLPKLYSGVDLNKDQSYFLSMTQGTNLRQCLFPVGHLLKAEVKAIARDRLSGLRVLEKRESTGVCFIGERNMPSFLQQYIDLHPGRFIDIDSGAVVGHHSGKELYTLGRSLSMRFLCCSRMLQATSLLTVCVGQKAKIKSQKDKYYVVAKSHSHDDVIVALGSSHPALYCQQVVTSIDDFSWIAGIAPLGLAEGEELKLLCKVRYRDPSIACRVKISSARDRLIISLDQASVIVAAGQVVALYHGKECLGGGIVQYYQHYE
jgi:tRNA-uridine 2-sulfurtransferase